MRQRDLTPNHDFSWLWPAFSGAKLVLLCEGDILTYRRDVGDHLPFPDHWDLPGGGREDGESPVECALRELHEEFGLCLPPDRLRGHVFPSAHHPGLQSWLFGGPPDDGRDQGHPFWRRRAGMAHDAVGRIYEPSACSAAIQIMD